MKGIISVLAASLVLVPGLAACGGDEDNSAGDDSGGGGEETTLTAEEFATEADALCEQFNKDNPIPPQPKNAKEAAESAQSEADLRIELMEALTALGAPEELQADLDSYNEQTLAIVDVIEDQVSAAEADDQEAFNAGFAEIDQLTAKRSETGDALGFEYCGQPASVATG